MTRRTALAGLGELIAAGAVTRAAAQTPPDTTPRFGRSAPQRTTPLLCVYSQNMIRVPYPQVGDIAAQLGYEGVDLTVMIGGHVDPRITNVDLVLAFESIRGSGLEVPMISTNITTVADPTSYPVLYLTGHSQIPLFRTGTWPYGTAPIARRLLQVKQELIQLTMQAQRCEMAVMIPNRAGELVGEAVWDTQSIIGDLDPKLVGYYFDPAEAMAEGGLGGWEAALRIALPRLKAVSLQDFYWKKDGDNFVMQKCPLGEGMVDWGKFFARLAAVRFTGPISIHTEYNPQDAPGAMGKDLEFARTHLQKAWSARQDESKS